MPDYSYTRTIFLDRDGVLNEDRHDYVKNCDELIVFPFVGESVARLNQAGYRVIVISNQQGVAKKHISEDDLESITQNVLSEVAGAGGKIEAFYYCKHLKEDNCECRKPKAGLILQACRDYQIDPSQCFMVGDTEKDMLAAQSAGCKPILVLSGHTTEEMVSGLPVKPQYVARNLSEAVDYVLSESNG